MTTDPSIQSPKLLERNSSALEGLREALSDLPPEGSATTQGVDVEEFAQTCDLPPLWIVDGRKYYLDAPEGYVACDARSFQAALTAFVDQAVDELVPWPDEAELHRMSREERKLLNSQRSGMMDTLKEALTLRLAREHAAVLAGPLAGHQAGPITIGSGEIMLVTRSPRLVDPAPGEWQRIDGYLRGLIPDELQRLHLFAWIKTFLEGLHARREGAVDYGFQGQALVIAGPRNCGKSLLKQLLIRLCGGRTANPHQYMTGGTGFNAECAGAEILEIDDQQEGVDFAERRRLASRIKEFCVAGPVRFHPKGLTPVVLHPYQRILILLNDGVRDMLVLPEADSSVADKIMLLRASPPESPFPTETADARKAFWASLESELPAFAHHLLHEFEIPADLRCERFGVRTYHDPQLFEQLNSLDQTTAPLEMLDQLFDSPRAVWAMCLDEDGSLNRFLTTEPRTQARRFTGTASQLRRVLTEVFSDREMREAFGDSAVRTGILLSQIREKHPGRISWKSRQNQKVWTIHPPAPTEDAAPEMVPAPPLHGDTTTSSTDTCDAILEALYRDMKPFTWPSSQSTGQPG